MALNPIFWIARWGTTPAVMPVFLVTSILLMIPGSWKFVASLWVHNKDLYKLNEGYLFIIRMIPFFNYAYILLCWVINILLHLVADLFNGDMSDFDGSTYTYRSTGEDVGGMRAFPLKAA